MKATEARYSASQLLNWRDACSSKVGSSIAAGAASVVVSFVLTAMAPYALGERTARSNHRDLVGDDDLGAHGGVFVDAIAGAPAD